MYTYLERKAGWKKILQFERLKGFLGQFSIDKQQRKSFEKVEKKTMKNKKLQMVHSFLAFKQLQFEQLLEMFSTLRKYKSMRNAYQILSFPLCVHHE